MQTRSKTLELKKQKARMIARAAMQNALMDAQQLAKAKRLQKNVVLVDSTHEERSRLRRDHRRALAIAWEYAGYQPVRMFLFLSEKIQQAGNPWLLTKQGYSPSSFKADLWKKDHFILYQTWRNWRAAVPRPT